MRRRRLRYMLELNSRSSSRSWVLVKAVRILLPESSGWASLDGVIGRVGAQGGEAAVLGLPVNIPQFNRMVSKMYCYTVT